MNGAILGLLPLFGEGPMFLEIVDLDLNVMAALTLTEEGYVQVCCLWDIVLRAVVQQLLTPPPAPHPN